MSSQIEYVEKLDFLCFVFDRWRTVAGVYHFRAGYILAEKMNDEIVRSMNALRDEGVFDSEFLLDEKWRSAIDEIAQGRSVFDLAPEDKMRIGELAHTFGFRSRTALLRSRFFAAT